MTYLLGLDLGTSGVKALLLSAPPARARPTSGTIDIPLSTPRPGWSEQDPADWWRATTEAIRGVLDRSRVDPGQIAALATSGQMHGATLLDRDGVVLRPAILWNDQRSGVECDIITERVGLENLLDWVGNPALAGFTVPKLLWIRAHESDVYRDIAMVLLPKDYLNYRLTGRKATEVSDASGTLLFDVVRRVWSEDLARELDIPLSIMPPVQDSTHTVGCITAEASAATGLRQGTPVVAGGADNACAAIGMGVVRPGQVLASIGTSGTLVAPTAAPRIDPQGRLHSFCHAVPDTWYTMGVVLSAGGSLRWYRDTIGEPERRRAEAEGRDPYDEILAEAAAVPPGSDGLIFLPYLTGERTPHGDPRARGAFVGLSLIHGRAHLARAVLEGVAYALGDAAALMRALYIEIRAVHATGGGARSRLWRRILAATLDSHVLTSPGDRGPAFGASLLAGVGVGVFPSVQEATDQLVEIGEQTAPEADLVSVYRAGQAVYDGLYPALQPTFRRLSEPL